MSQRDRVADTALGLVVGLGLALLLVAWAVPEFRYPAAAVSPPESGGQAEQAKPQQNQQTTTGSTPIGQPQVESADKTDNTNQPCKAGQDNRNSDLCAQWKAADAAKESADWARQSYWLILAGTVIGFMTFCAAIAAAIYAGQAAVHTRRSADIAEKALLDIERPHIFVEKIKALRNINESWLDIPEGKFPFFEVTYDTLNYGRTPAIITEIKAGIRFGSLPAVPHWHPGEITGTMEVVIAPSNKRTATAFYRGNITRPMVAELLFSNTYIPGREPTRIYFYGTIKYRSVHGAEDEIGFIFRYLPQGNMFLLESIAPYTFRRLSNPKNVQGS